VAEELLGRFRLLGEAARSDSATLHRARDEISGEDASVATLAPESIRSMGDERAFRKRVQTLRAMDSPHVDPPLSAGFLDGTWFVAVPGAPGSTFREISERLGPLAPDRAWALGAQLFRALSHLHARNVIVGQLTPEAVSLGADGVVRIWRALVRGRTKSGGKTLALGKADFAQMAYTPADAGQDKRDRDVYGAGMAMAHLLAGGPPVQPQKLPELLSFYQKPSFPFSESLAPELATLLHSTVSPVASQRPPARRAYSVVLAATGMKARQMERLSEQVAEEAGAGPGA
jgi:serine/threonine protein kinase